MPIMGREFMEETSAEKTAELFPYLKERFDALKDIRQWEYDMAKVSNMGRRFAKNGVLGRRIASLPWHIVYYWKSHFGFPITQDKKLFKAWLAMEQNAPYRAS